MMGRSLNLLGQSVPHSGWGLSDMLPCSEFLPFSASIKTRR